MRRKQPSIPSPPNPPPKKKKLQNTERTRKEHSQITRLLTKSPEEIEDPTLIMKIMNDKKKLIGTSKPNFLLPK
jgi:hypothetical protein